MPANTHRTWSILGRAKALSTRCGEESLTDLLVLDMLLHLEWCSYTRHSGIGKRSYSDHHNGSDPASGIRRRASPRLAQLTNRVRLPNAPTSGSV